MPKIPALTVKQWLPEWDQTLFEPAPPRSQPDPIFYVFSMSAYQLKRLTGIYRRDPKAKPAEDMGIQRRHDPDRSKEILRYIQDGFPLSRIDRKKLVDQNEERPLRMPGWLPTAVIVNILTAEDKRGPKNRKVAKGDLIKVRRKDDVLAEIRIPNHFLHGDWYPRIHPIEVIDGQHRLWAMEQPDDGEERWSEEFKNKIGQLQVPVVAFYGLDATWRAYLFYTINQLPKKIDTSMVFDLYPLLRVQNWLLRFEGPKIYRQTRAQDLTILLWSHPQSPWHDRIIRLGGREKGKVTQASFIQSLMASFIKRFDAANIGGFFGSSKGTHQTQLNWIREQQAAFLIFAWQALQQAITNSSAPWTKALLKRDSNKSFLFSGSDTLIATDQGVRGYLNVLNDVLWMAFSKGLIEIDNWTWDRRPNQDDTMAITDALKDLKEKLPHLTKLVQQVSSCLASFDWRLSSAVSPDDPAYSQQASYRGSGGYRLIRQALLTHIRKAGSPPISDLANEAIQMFQYEPEDEE